MPGNEFRTGYLKYEFFFEKWGRSMKLDSRQMAEFVARGVLRFDAAIPDDINQAFIDAAGRLDTPDDATPKTSWRHIAK